MALPTARVTFLFSDIEGSTRMARSMPTDRWAGLLQLHDDLVDAAVTGHGGSVVKHEGDGTFAAFRSARDAALAAIAISRSLADADWDELALRVRIGIHTGEAQLTRDGADYLGVDVHYAARVAGAANGGQILLSDDTRADLHQELPAGATIQPLGAYRFRDFEEARPLHALVVPGAADDSRPIRAISLLNLPRHLTAFVGRSAERERVSELLDRARLVTLTGPGGTGKTRLAIGVAEDVAARFDDGVAFVELAPVVDPDLVPATVAAAVGVAERPDQSTGELLRTHLADKALLLVLDNLEQLLPRAATDVATLVREAPRLRVLVSSREPLRIDGEQEYPVPPLGPSEAEALFLDRARLARPEFAPSGAEADAVAEIARRLEGLPLAIELAAARVRLYAPSGILERLGRSLDLLSGGARDLPERQRTLRGAIGWSYELLAPEEQAIFRRLAVLVGDWSMESATGVVTGDGMSEFDVADGLASLVDKSLLRMVPSGHGDTLFGRHVFIREYALEQLEASGERADYERRHAMVFRDLATSTGPHLIEADAERFLHLFDDAIHDLRQAMTWSLEIGEPEVGLDIIGSAWRWWQIRASMRDGREWASRLLAHPAAQEDSQGRLRGLAALGSLAYWSMDYATTRRAYDDRLAIAQRLGDRRELAEAHYDLSFCGVVERDLELHSAEASAALELFEELGDEHGIVRARQSLVLARFLGGDAEGARRLEEANLERFRETQSLYRVADSLMLMSAIDRLDHNVPLALSHAREALRSMPSHVGGATIGAIGVIAIVEAESGDVRYAARLTGAIRAIQAKTGETLAPVAVLHLPDPEDLVRDRLPRDEADALMAEGARLTPDEAIAAALGEPTPGSP